MRFFVTVACCLIAGGVSAEERSPPMEIELHTYWKTEGERGALSSLVESMGSLNLQVNIVESEEYNVLRQNVSKRIGLGYPPEISQWLGGENLEQLVGEDTIFLSPQFSDRDVLRNEIHPEVIEQITVDGSIYAIPVGIHLQNSMIYNMDLLAKVGVYDLPETWAEFDGLVAKLRAASILPYAGSAKPWVINNLFDSLTVSVGQRDLMEELYSGKAAETSIRAPIHETMGHFVKLRNLTGPDGDGREWDDAVRMVIEGDAAITIIGDYAWSEISTHGVGDLSQYRCSALPGLDSPFFGVDIFVAFETSLPDWHRQYGEMLEVILRQDVQYQYLQKKGGISVVKGIDPDGLNPCSRVSLERWEQAPEQRFSDPGSRDHGSTAIIQAVLFEIWRNQKLTTQEATDLFLVRLGRD
ncbi:ABC transporter substrate-binding protein [Sulfitobacter donghicola]|uniref:Probable sugar-binding periplasmic protein n=1 Tax=Sulfitobacter donghicola DSW-25 = KCTC 12864 = JCM 14565 TaxID=1300350 RepID=A0A073IFN2_9RHOB|nr:ABC transporter substrate-binding protein [Sulfitobacter donghicola]KEJ89163.1 hypothetical protein DSW25_12630 [Sulfitobacter donghicola DSW-25 = KCTC 12864 = JCM 14565]KIN67362.1 ABC-type sugar transport system, periplasmic component [Sulfitobacter donghicola DSW-25 = KCTC 12864 = JCM 14565]